MKDTSRPKKPAKIWETLKRIGKAILREKKFVDSSAKYWDKRYQSGGNSGAGSYGKFADWKAEVLNAFVQENNVQTVIELGCGDGNQLSLAEYPAYIGFDVSEYAVEMCCKRFESDNTKSFKHMNNYHAEKAELTLSLDVIYHLVEDDVFENYMKCLFESSSRFVVIYSSNDETLNADTVRHVRHRKFTDWIDKNFPQWRFIKTIPNKYPQCGNHLEGSFSDFFFYEKRDVGQCE